MSMSPGVDGPDRSHSSPRRRREQQRLESPDPVCVVPRDQDATGDTPPPAPILAVFPPVVTPPTPPAIPRSTRGASPNQSRHRSSTHAGVAEASAIPHPVTMKDYVTVAAGYHARAEASATGGVLRASLFPSLDTIMTGCGAPGGVAWDVFRARQWLCGHGHEYTPAPPLDDSLAYRTTGTGRSWAVFEKKNSSS
jgi:hypothetical protein